MIEFIKSTDFLIPFISNTFLIFLSTRLYSLRNMPYEKLKSEFNFTFVLGKIIYKLGIYLTIVFLIINFIKGIYLKPITAIVLSVFLAVLLTKNKRLSPSTEIPYPIMTFNCILITVVFIVFSIHTFSLV